jgi:hypothetical protein
LKSFSLGFICLFLATLGPNALGVIQIGIEGGINLAKLPNNFGASYTQKTGLALGANIAIELPVDGLSIRAEPMYIEKGAYSPSSVTGLGGQSLDIILSYTYLDVPVLLRYAFGTFIRPYLFAGPYFGIKLSSNDIRVADGSGTSDPNVAATDWGFTGGVGLEIQLGPLVSLYADGRYIYGIQNINTANGSSFSNRDLLVTAGADFGF